MISSCPLAPFFRVATLVSLIASVTLPIPLNARRLKQFASRRQPHPQSDSDKSQSMFSSGGLFVHSQLKHQFQEALKEGTTGNSLLQKGSALQIAREKGDVVEQMKEWNSTGRLFGALSTSQISPNYKGSTLYSELSYLLDGQQCNVISAAPFDQYVSNHDFAEGGKARAAEMQRVATQFLKHQPDMDKKLQEVGMQTNPYKFYFVGEDDDVYANVIELANKNPASIRFVTGGAPGAGAHATIQTALAEDVDTILENKFTRSQFTYTEVVLDCPVEALLGIVITLPTWKGLDPTFDVTRLRKLAVAWARRVHREVAVLRGQPLVVAHYVPGGGVEDKPQHCPVYCGDKVSDFKDLDPAQLKVLEWVPGETTPSLEMDATPVETKAAAEEKPTETAAVPEDRLAPVENVAASVETSAFQEGAGSIVETVAARSSKLRA